MDCVKELLNVMDTFERALEAPCTDENYKKGVELTFAQIQKAFEKLGVTEIAALGETFDPNLHNAIKQVDDSEYESDKVCEVFQKGYLLGDRLIRPAMVAVFCVGRRQDSEETHSVSHDGGDAADTGVDDRM